MLSKLVFDYRRIILYFVISISISSVNCHFHEIPPIISYTMESVDMGALQDQIDQQSVLIEKLTQSHAADVAGFENQIQILSDQNKDLQNKLDNAKKQIVEGEVEKDITIQNLVTEVNELDINLNELVALVNKNEKARLPSDCAEDIANNRFDDAEKKLNQIESINQSIFDFIVRTVYAYKPTNFDLLDAFARHLSNIEYSLRVYKSLEFVTRTSINNELNIVKLAQGVKDKVMPKIDNMPFQNEARLFFGDMKNIVKEVCRSLFVQAMMNLFSHEFIHVISDHVWHLDRQLFRDLIDVVIEGVIAMKVDLQTIINNLKQQSYVPQILAGYGALALKIDCASYNCPKFGYYLQQMKNGQNYNQIDSEARQTFENRMEKLPQWLQNVVFWPKCCIRTNAYSEHLYAATDGFNFDRWRRRVFIWTRGGTGTQFYFNFEFDKDGYVFIKNLQYNEYMYSSGYEYSTGTLVFTWIDGTKVSNGRWNLVHSDNQRVRILYNGLYLRASQDLFNNDRRYVVTQSQPSDADLWYIDRC